MRLLRLKFDTLLAPQVWDLREGLPFYTLLAHEGPPLAAAFSPDGEQFASGGGDRAVLLWRTGFGRSPPTPSPSRPSRAGGSGGAPPGDAVSYAQGHLGHEDRAGGRATQPAVSTAAPAPRGGAALAPPGAAEQRTAHAHQTCARTAAAEVPEPRAAQEQAQHTAETHGLGEEVADVMHSIICQVDTVAQVGGL